MVLDWQQAHQANLHRDQPKGRGKEEERVPTDAQ